MAAADAMMTDGDICDAAELAGAAAFDAMGTEEEEDGDCGSVDNSEELAPQAQLELLPAISTSHLPHEIRVVDGYQILHGLGKGVSGKVKLGRDLLTGDSVALKIVVPRSQQFGAGFDHVERQQLLREIEAMKALEQPNVLQLLHVNTDCQYPKKNGKTFMPCVLMVLELASGGELFDFLSFTGPFPEAIARTYFQQLVAALQACHRAGIYHRDLKPENLLLDSQFQLKVADFGLSAVHDASDPNRLHSTHCGTPGYMPPEIIALENAPQAQYDAALADIWSAGVVLFIMLTGFPPFQIARVQDWWFNELDNRRYDRFWMAHQRTAPWLEQMAPVKDLLNAMFSTNPAHRATLDAIQTHPWVRGPAFPPEALDAEMTRRHEQVQAAKEERRQAIRAQRLAERRQLQEQQARAATQLPIRQGGENMFNTFEAPVMRSLSNAFGVDTDIAPVDSFATEEDPFAYPSELASSATIASATAAAAAAAAATSPAAAPPAYPHECQSHRVYSSFMSIKSAEHMLDSLERVLSKDLRARSIQMKRSAFKVTAICPAISSQHTTAGGKGDVELTVRIYAADFSAACPGTEGNDEDDGVDSLYVEVHRRAGNRVHFNALFALLLTNLGESLPEETKVTLDDGVGATGFATVPLQGADDVSTGLEENELV